MFSRTKADEAYLVGKGLAPVAAYLDVPGIVRIAQVMRLAILHWTQMTEPRSCQHTASATRSLCQLGASASYSSQDFASC